MKPTQESSTQVMSGTDIFLLMDTHGIPYPVVRSILKMRDFAFDISEFIFAAKESGNYNSPRKLSTLMTQDLVNENVIDMTNRAIVLIYTGKYTPKSYRK